VCVCVPSIVRERSND